MGVAIIDSFKQTVRTLQLVSPVQYEPVQAAADVTTTSSTPVKASTLTNGGSIPTFSFTPTGTTMDLYVNMFCLGSASMLDAGICWLDTGNADAIVSKTQSVMLSSNNRVRYTHGCHLTGLTAGHTYTYALGFFGDGTHAFGTRVGTEYPILMYALDPLVSIQPNAFIGVAAARSYREVSLGDNSGSSVTSTSLIQFVMGPSNVGPLNFPAFVAPSTGQVLVRCVSGQWVTASSSSVDTAMGIWDNDAAAAVAGTSSNLMGGGVSIRTNPHYERLVTGLTPGHTYNWSIGVKLMTAGTNVSVAKPGDDSVEGPFVIEILGVGI